MALTPSNSIELGQIAQDFNLYEPKSDSFLALKNLRGKEGTLIMFICNHCPYVVHIIEGIVNLANDYMEKGVSFIAINSNDVENYPEDSPDKMIDFSKKYAIPFPYLYDESQEVAKLYDAVCTPDFNLVNSDGHIIYRGRFDAARPGNNIELTGIDMRNAIDRMLAGRSQDAEQAPSIGCNIKWK